MDHLHQIQRAVDFIEANLREDILIEDIAKEAAISKWHFQIVFSSVVGETVKEYVRKRRLSIAHLEIGKNKKRLIEIALDAGFNSQEAFTRSFKETFGITPGESRKKGMLSKFIFNKPKITMEYLEHLYKGVNMKPIIKNIEEIKMIGMKKKFISVLSTEKNNHIVIPELWDQYLKNENKIKYKKSSTRIGICMPLNDNEVKSHSDECLYLAGTEVTNIEDVPKDMVAQIVPAGNYAIFTHKGSLDQIGYTINYIYGSWLPKSGRKLREAPDLEVYDERFNFDSTNSEVDIYIPIE